MKIAKKIQTIICDDVRDEVGNKVSLMGIYSKDIFIKQVPYIKPMIYLVIMLEEIEQSFNKIFVELITPKQEPFKIEQQAPAGLNSGINLNLVIGISPFRITAFGPARFEIRFSKEKKSRIIHRFEIKKIGN